ncbi:MAG: RidA family protein [Ktedonobacterales bacterium]|nr:RidA family protein [Ktedonobacterales bacterium]
MEIERKLEALGLSLPQPFEAPAGLSLPFAQVRIHGDRAYIAGHGPMNADGSLRAPLGKVGAEASIEEGYAAAHATALAMLGSLKRELGDLDRVVAWLRVFGMVNVAPDFTQTPAVINGFSHLILQVYGPEIGRHARSAIGVAALPFNMLVEVEAEVAIRG